MLQSHLVRVGVMGHIGRFGTADGVRYLRSTRVIVRTERGLEIGEVLSHIDACDLPGVEESPTVVRSQVQADGEVLRQMKVEDELLVARLEKNRNEAFEACEEILAEHQFSATLFDVEYLFDGKGLYFYFLGDVGPELEERLAELAQRYDAVAQLSQFAETLTNGCGPDCGTEGASGSGCDSCTSCTIVEVCREGHMPSAASSPPSNAADIGEPT